MKNFHSFILAFIFSFALHSQNVDQGNFFIEPNTSFNMTTTGAVSYEYDGEKDTDLSDDKFTTTNIALSAGYFLADNLAVGLSASYNAFKSTVAGVSTSIDDMTYGALVRYYFGGVAYVEGGYGLKSNPNGIDLSDSDIKITNSDMYGKVGAAIFLTDEIAFTPSVKYNINTNKETFGGVSATGVNYNLVISGGFTIYL